MLVEITGHALDRFRERFPAIAGESPEASLRALLRASRPAKRLPNGQWLTRRGEVTVVMQRGTNGVPCAITVLRKGDDNES